MHPNDIANALEHLESGKPIILHHDGKAVAGLISIEDLHLLDRLIEEEDRIDLAEAEIILTEVEEEGTVSWESIKAEAGL